VQDDTKLNELRTKWEKAACKSGICPAIACLVPGPGVCKATPDPSDSVGAGLCSDERLATTQ
jgi:hypothetical protein